MVDPSEEIVSPKAEVLLLRGAIAGLQTQLTKFSEEQHHQQHPEPNARAACRPSADDSGTFVSTLSKAETTESTLAPPVPANEFAAQDFAAVSDAGSPSSALVVTPAAAQL